MNPGELLWESRIFGHTRITYRYQVFESPIGKRKRSEFAVQQQFFTPERDARPKKRKDNFHTRSQACFMGYVGF